MAKLIVIRIIPEAPTDPNTFTGYLSSTLGELQITAYDLSFNSPTTGQVIGSASYVKPTTAASPTSSENTSGGPVSLEPATYPANTTSGIIQEYDLMPSPGFDQSAFFQLESVATAIIEVNAPAAFENLRLTAQWGSGAGAASILITTDYYDVALAEGPAPDPNTGWNLIATTSIQRDQWSTLPPSIYLQIPAAPTPNTSSFSLPSDGSVPPFDALLAAVEEVLNIDPGISATTTGTPQTGNVLQLNSTANISAGMTVTGPAGTIHAGTRVSAVTSATSITLTEPVTATVNSGVVIQFQPDLASLSLAQCQNIAYEIVWSQQPPIPAAPDPSDRPLEELYTNPPNNGVLLSGTTPNQYEGDRQEFEANLKTYYATPDTEADRLTNYIYALSAAVACEEMSLAATEVLLDFPVNPGSPNTAPVSDTEVILTGFEPALNFGIPAAHFYALGATLPPQITGAQRYQMATGDTLERLLSELTAAISAGTINDSEAYVTTTASAINAAQSARRIAVLNVPGGSSTPLAPLSAIQLQTDSEAASGTTTLSFSSTIGVEAGMSVSGPNIPNGTTVSAVTANLSVTLSQSVSNKVVSGASITFAPVFSGDLANLVNAWLVFPASVAGTISSAAYQSGDDDTEFWPGAAAAHSAAFLNLVLAALTQGYIVPEGSFDSLGDIITSQLLAPLAAPQQPTVATLDSLTTTQWTGFFNADPTRLPSFTLPGNTPARITVFIRYVQRFFATPGAGPGNPINLTTNGSTAAGNRDLHFTSTSGTLTGMTVKEGSVSLGTVTNVAATIVTLSQGVPAGGITSGAVITFIPSPGAVTGSSQPASPSSDLLTTCLGYYGAFAFGSGFDLANLKNAAAKTFQNQDQAGQEWLVNALVNIDALYQVVKSVPPPTTVSASDSQNYTFSLVEALYARGFTSAADVTELSSADFPQALIGTIAYDLATPIYNAAKAIVQPPSPPSTTTTGFQPINPDGSLTNCIPPGCVSPLGPVAYLSELLRVAESCTCEEPLASSVSLPTNGDTPSGVNLPFASTTGISTGMYASGTNIAGNSVVSGVTANSVMLSQPVMGDVPNGTDVSFTTVKTLGFMVAQRRGSVGTLAATGANCETPLPLIDIVNECLEFMGSVMSPANGTVYNTSADTLGGLKLCRDNCDGQSEEEPAGCCHQPATLFAALPEYSTPAAPVPADSAVEPDVFSKLEVDFSSCCLPYSQALDVNRTYLHQFRSCRYDEMRTFRRCITEFVLDPLNEPTGFEDYLLRYPVRTDTAIEYLGIAPEEFLLLFNGQWPKPCGGGRGVNGDKRGSISTQQLYGVSPTVGDPVAAPTDWTQTVVQLPGFLERTCLTYCEFLELWKSGFVPFSNGGDDKAQREGTGVFPDCEPCCLEKLWLQFPEEPGAETALYQLAVFIRLWRKLKRVGGAGYSFDQLRDICDVLHLFNGTAINPDFIRELVAFQMLRDNFCLPLMDPADPPKAGTTDAQRTHLLALWVGTTASKWQWAVNQMLNGVERFAQQRRKYAHRSPEFRKILAQNLDAVSQLAGFNPAAPAPPIDDRWQALPTHTLRFAEVLAKIYVSNFHLDEIFYLFTAGKSAGAERPFPLPDEDEALDSPLSLPDDEHEYSLWKLRHKLLEVCLSEEEVCHWSWRKIEACLQGEFGYAAGEVLAFGRHFFPGILQSEGYSVDPEHRRYSISLDPGQTTPGMWSASPGGPFEYDPVAKALWVQLPLSDQAVIEQLERLQQLNPQERQAVQDLYFQARNTLAPFAFLFVDFAETQYHLIEEKDERERWIYFKRQFVLSHTRCRIVAEHLARHVECVTHEHRPEGAQAAFRVLQSLFADENKALTDWEADSGQPPKVTWPQPSGGAFAALLGLTGTGLLREFAPEGGTVAWRDLSGPLWSFGREENRVNCPVPTVLPSLGFNPTAPASITIRNGLALENANGEWLGGAEGFGVNWTGALLVDREGRYEFYAGAPTPECEEPDHEAAEQNQWRITLKRGQKTWLLLNHNWPGETGTAIHCLRLRRGAYDIIVDFKQPAPSFGGEKPCRQHTGFQVKYTGPDTDERLTQIPHNRLFRALKDLKLTDQDRANLGSKWEDLGYGITGLASSAASFLNAYYSSSLRDIRRTYQRAFKAFLFVHRFALSGERSDDHRSELGYLLTHSDNFAGLSYYRVSPAPAPPTPAFTQHAADFDFDLLPLVDDYYPPSPADDSRVQPSTKRTQAMFDWWERIFDYDRLRHETHSHRHGPLWQLFQEATAEQPTNPGSLLHYLGVDPQHWTIDLRYYQDQYSPVYAVTWSDLADERWLIRAWHAEKWLHSVYRSFTVKDITEARPDLWAADDPSAPVLGEGTLTGNANLTAFFVNGCIENGEPRRYKEIKSVNDGLRERGRSALVAYLCRMNRVALPWLPGQFAAIPRELSAFLLLDVEAGIGEKASRIDEAITAVQQFVRRARLNLESDWKVSPEFARLWDRQFASFEVWQACKRRHLYKENFIEWDELEKARHVEAFRFLESELCSSTLSVAVPGGVDWWPDERPPGHGGLETLQSSEASELQLLPNPREGLNLIGSTECAAQPSWLTTVLSSNGNTTTDSNQAAGSPSGAPLPFWIKAAIRLGTRFYRVAAADSPPAAMGFEPHKKRDKGCVECCQECGCHHPVSLDEYYFWLVDGGIYNPPPLPTGIPGTEPDDFQYGYQDDYYDSSQQQSAFWDDTKNLPQLLEWQSSPMVRLAWCRVHNGQFQQPRRSAKGVPVQSISGADLVFQGRSGDSLTFSVTNPVTPAPVPGYADPSAPGFRYDLTCDHAVVLPRVIAPPAASSYPGGLPAYPWFVYYQPGSHLFPLSVFSPALAVAAALRTHCRFEPALRWYRLAFDPLIEDCTWVHCPGSRSTPPSGNNASSSGQPNGNSPSTPTQPASGNTSPIAAPKVESSSRAVVYPVEKPTTCCDSTDVSCAVAKNRSGLLHYLETLRDWGKAVMRRNTPEAFQHAHLIFDTASLILGKRPSNVLLPEPTTPQQVSGFKPYFAPLNPRLLDLYDVVHDHLDLIHASVDSRRLRNGRLNRDMQFFGDSLLREGWHTAVDTCAEEGDWCHLQMPYRFLFRIQKALEYAGKVRELGAALLSAFEKGDAEYLAALRAGQEREILVLGLEARKDQWRDADWQVEALQKTKAVNQANLAYYNGLIQNGLIGDEISYEDLTITSTVIRAASDISEAIAQSMNSSGNFFTGGAGFGGSPLVCDQPPVGQPLGEAFAAAARILNSEATVASTTAGLDLTEAGWQRRLDEWIHQSQIFTIEIEQAEQQILGAQRRRDQALQDLNSHQRQLEHSTEIQNFLRDKFTAHDLYLFLQAETTALFNRMYELALQTARQAERAFNFERGHTTRQFLPEHALCGTLREKLLAGERLELALHRMEKAYLDLNIREYELTKHLSLRLQFPMQYLQLRTTGYCEIDIPEWMFDLDYPGMYMRRIKNVTLTIPCVTGPYAGVHCRLTLLSSVTRIDPRLSPPPHLCCCDRRRLNDYDICLDDPRVARQYAAREAIATSSGQNDSGLFQLNFQDERYLPFEYLGAVSRWRIELPPQNNYFELDTVSDLILNLNYTGREGGDLLRRAASEAAERRLPGDGWCFFDVRHEFPDAWQMLRDSSRDRKSRRRLGIKFSRRMFPFIPGHREISITALALLFETVDCDGAASHLVSFKQDGEEHRRQNSEQAGIEERGAGNHRPETTNGEHDERERIRCVSSDDLPRLYHGVIKTQIGPLVHDDRRQQATFGFDDRIGDIWRIFLLCQYNIQGEPRSTEPYHEVGWTEQPRRDESGRSQPPEPARNEIAVASRR
jgi:Tc toxin complex TcA C-terminal TcB-binding domain